MTTLRFAHFPNHGPSVRPTTIMQMAKQTFDSAGVSEGYKAVPLLRALYHDEIKTYASAASKVDAFGRRPSFDNPVLVRPNHTLIDQSTYRVTRAWRANLKWNPERWLNWVAYQVDGAVVCHITTHPDPNVHTRRYRRAMKALEKRIVWAKAQGWLVVVTGDFQTGDTHTLRGLAHDRSHRPADIFYRQGLVSRVEHLDWIAVDNHFSVGEFHVIPAGHLTPGEDHPWLTLTVHLPAHWLIP